MPTNINKQLLLLNLPSVRLRNTFWAMDGWIVRCFGLGWVGGWDKSKIKDDFSTDEAAVDDELGNILILSQFLTSPHI